MACQTLDIIMTFELRSCLVMLAVKLVPYSHYAIVICEQSKTQFRN